MNKNKQSIGLFAVRSLTRQSKIKMSVLLLALNATGVLARQQKLSESSGSLRTVILGASLLVLGLHCACFIWSEFIDPLATRADEKDVPRSGLF